MWGGGMPGFGAGRDEGGGGPGRGAWAHRAGNTVERSRMAMMIIFFHALASAQCLVTSDTQLFHFYSTLVKRMTTCLCLSPSFTSEWDLFSTPL